MDYTEPWQQAPCFYQQVRWVPCDQSQQGQFVFPSISYVPSPWTQDCSTEVLDQIADPGGWTTFWGTPETYQISAATAIQGAALLPFTAAVSSGDGLGVHPGLGFDLPWLEEMSMLAP